MNTGLQLPLPFSTLNPPASWIDHRRRLHGYFVTPNNYTFRMEGFHRRLPTVLMRRGPAMDQTKKSCTRNIFNSIRIIPRTCLILKWYNSPLLINGQYFCCLHSRSAYLSLPHALVTVSCIRWSCSALYAHHVCVPLCLSYLWANWFMLQCSPAMCFYVAPALFLEEFYAHILFSLYHLLSTACILWHWDLLVVSIIKSRSRPIFPLDLLFGSVSSHYLIVSSSM